MALDEILWYRDKYPDIKEAGRQLAYSRDSVCLAAERWSAVEASRFAETEDGQLVE